MKSVFVGTCIAGAIVAVAVPAWRAALGAGATHDFGAAHPAQARARQGDSTAYEDPARSVNEFAFRLVRAVWKQNHNANILLCPLSAFATHSMLLAGATGETQHEIQSALAIAGQADSVHEKVHALTDALTSTEGKELKMANEFFSLEPMTLEPKFDQTLRTCYDAGILQLSGPGQDSLKKINDWARDHTQGMVPKVLDRLDRQAQYAVASAASFVGTWAVRFDPGQTREEPFKGPNGESVQASTMHLDGVMLRYYHDENVEAIRLDYGTQPFAMYVLLPSERSSIEKLVQSLSGAEWDKRAERWGIANVYLSLPKMEFDSHIDLVPPLQSLGMRRLFRSDAQLGGISDLSKGTYILQDVQAAHIEVDEKGTRAAGATVAVGGKGMPPETVRFTVDRPFVYAVVDTNSGAIAFLGVCQDPTLKR